MKKLLALCTSLVLVASLFAGCGGNNSNSSSDTASKGTDSVDSGSAEKTDFDFGGGTFTISSSYEHDTLELGQSDYLDARHYAAEYAKKKYNVGEIKYNIQTTDYKEQFTQATLAGSFFSDEIECHSWYYQDYIKQDMIQPVTSYMEKQDATKWDLEAGRYRDEIYSVCPLNPPTCPNHFVVYNTDLLNTLSVEDPQELDKQGKWNIDVFTDYMKKVTNANEGIYGNASFGIENTLFEGFGVDQTYHDETDGKYYNYYSHPKTKENASAALQTLYDWFNKEKCVVDSGAVTEQDKNFLIENFQDGKLLFGFADGGLCQTYKQYGLDNFKPVCNPYGGTATTRKQVITDWIFFGVSNSTDYTPDQCAAFLMDYQEVRDESRGDAYYVKEKDTIIEEMFADYFNERSDAEYMYDSAQEMVTYYNKVTFGGTTVFDVYAPLKKGESTVGTVIESTDKQLQSCIDDFYGQKA